MGITVHPKAKLMQFFQQQQSAEDKLHGLFRFSTLLIFCGQPTISDA
jgi:hypothetical protein